MKRRDRAVSEHEDRSPDLSEALESLGAVPIVYAGSWTDGAGRVLGRICTPGTVEALIAGVNRVRDVLGSREECRVNRGGPCVPCSSMTHLWLYWRIADGGFFAPGDEPAPSWPEEARRALNASVAPSWPDNYRATWRRLYDAFV